MMSSGHLQAILETSIVSKVKWKTEIFCVPAHRSPFIPLFSGRSLVFGYITSTGQWVDGLFPLTNIYSVAIFYARRECILTSTY
jgi:hypothetical protein